MRRSVGPWFRKSKNAWYVQHEGRQVNLKVRGKDNEKEAVKAWHRLMAGDDPTPSPVQEPTPPTKPTQRREQTPGEASVKQVVDGFLADAEGRMTAGCLRNYRIFLQPFSERFGSRLAE